MVDPNEEFEGFLRQFRLREIRPLPDAIAQRSGWSRRWTIAAAAAMCAVVISFAAHRAMRRETIAVPPQAQAPAAAKESASAPPLPVEVVREPEVQPLATVTKPSVVVQQPAEPPAPPPAAEPPPNNRGDDEGRETLQRVCGACHSTDAVTNLHFSTREEYANVISGEKAKAFGVSYSDKDFQTLVDYLFNTYGDKPAPARKKK
jgi:hypothetical protein